MSGYHPDAINEVLQSRSRNSRAQDTGGRRGELRQRRCRTQDNEGRDVRMPSGRNYQEDSRRARDQRTERRKGGT